MATRTYKFNQKDAVKIKEMLGNWDKVIFFFLGHEDRLYSYSGRSFKIAQGNFCQNIGLSTFSLIQFDFI